MATTSNSTRTSSASLPERALHVQLGAGLLARDNLVSAVRGMTTRYSTRASVQRGLTGYEKRSASARTRFERQVRRTRTRFERQLRQRRGEVGRFVSGAQSRIA